MRALRLGLAFSLVCAALSAAPVLAQSLQRVLPSDMYTENARTTGNTIRFCYSPLAVSAGFEKELISAIGDSLLIDSQLVEIPETFIKVHPLEYRLALTSEQMFFLLGSECDAILGFLHSSTVPEWLSVTIPYLEDGTILFSKNPDHKRLSDLPFGSKIGGRAMSNSDMRLAAYLYALPKDRSWVRKTYHNYNRMMQYFYDDTLDAAMIWGPALYHISNGDPAAHGYYEMSIPFPIDTTKIGMATRSNNTYLNQTLSTAIQNLTDDGTIAQLKLKQHLAPQGNQ